jgi:hypothetical protein
MDDVKRSSEDAGGDRFMNTSKCVISFSPILALSHQLLRQHHANMNVKGKRINQYDRRLMKRQLLINSSI